ncbi:hypothetical protein GOP47_0008791 [Adiantum capillus-veneris]|uniref:Uncharacterized protein n=1 Tax=Adiantum capillus-veneris TaxID=13818 RepID=A0A9D4UZ10_ADICA|nr:hypothetical protein GOP47_0008791 [Adiantum capillus-veneris]
MGEGDRRPRDANGGGGQAVASCCRLGWRGGLVRLQQDGAHVGKVAQVENRAEVGGYVGWWMEGVQR